MKKLLLFLLLFPLAVMAEFHPGTITMNDGSSKTGLIEVPATAEKNKIRFKADKDAQSEKFSIDDVKMFTVKFENDQAEVTYYALKLADLKTFKKEFKVSKRKSWVRMVKPGKVSIVAAYYYSPAIAGAVANTSTSGYNFYFWRPENDYGTFFYADLTSGISVSVGAFKALKKGVELNFNSDCPQLSGLLDKDDIKNNGLGRIVTLYQENCGK